MAEARRTIYSSSKPVPAYFKATINNDTMSRRKTSEANAVADRAPTNKYKCMIAVLITIATRSMTPRNRKLKTVKLSTPLLLGLIQALV